MVFRIEQTRKVANGSMLPVRTSGPAHPLLRLQHAAGNAAVTRLLGTVQRAPSGGSPPGKTAAVKGSGGAPTPRVVYLDNDVVGEVADGNKAVAESLQKLRASGADIRISRYNYVEATRGGPVGAGARRLIVKELGITIDEGGGLASRAGTYKELSTGKPVAVQPKDVPVIAAVRAAGPNAELWSLDGGVKQNAARFGVKLAPESSIPVARTTRPDVRTGLNNVGLQSWDIAADGTPVRRGQLIGTGRAPQPAPGVGTHAPTPQVGKGGSGGTVPRTTTRTPIRTGGGPTSTGGGGLAMMGGGLLTAGWVIAVPLINQWFAENYLQEKWATEQRKMVQDALAAHIPKFTLLILTRRQDILKARARNSPVILHVVVDTEFVETQYGPAQTSANVTYYTLLFEGDTAIPWPLFQHKRGFWGGFFKEPVRSRRRQIFDRPL